MKSSKRCIVIVAVMLFLPVLALAQNYSGAAACKSCHSNSGAGRIQYTQWAQTLHARAYDSIAVIQNNPNCLPCHTTGWDTSLANLGYDDYYPPASPADSTALAKLKNVQCESCHGPVKYGTGGNHGQPSTINPTAERCGQCHQGEHHPYYSEWQQAKHSISDTNAVPFLQTSFRTSAECSGCHTYQGFLEFVVDTNNTPNVLAPPGDAALPIVCAACHDPHSAANQHQLRLPKTELCQKCHNPQYNPDNPTPTGADLHHSTAFMLEGKGGYQYPSYTYDSSPHKDVATDKCVTCHVVATPFATGVPASTGHTFMPKTIKCYECHGDIDTLSSNFNYHNVQHEIDSLATLLTNKLGAASSSDSTTDAFKQAKFNRDFVTADGSHGVHNYLYAKGLLLSALANFTPTSVEREGNAIPKSFALGQNYPNPFNPSTTIGVDLAGRTTARLVVYNLLGERIATLMDGLYEPGRYTIVWSGLTDAGVQTPSGIYLFKLEAGNFTQVRKMLLMK